MSVPGLITEYLFSNIPDTYFSLFTEKEKDLYYTMKDNNVNDPHIIFNRQQEKKKTFICNTEMARKNLEPKPCKKVVGYDVNAFISVYRNCPDTLRFTKIVVFCAIWYKKYVNSHIVSLINYSEQHVFSPAHPTCEQAGFTGNPNILSQIIVPLTLPSKIKSVFIFSLIST